jgi:hypothetical protein
LPAAPQFKAPAFGAWLSDRRGGRSHEQIAVKVRKYVQDFGLQVNRSSILKYEQGRIPPWPVLYAFAEIFEVDAGQLAARLFSAIKSADGRDLLRHASAEGSTPHEGGADVPASAQRIATLEGEVSTLKARISGVQDAARKLLTLTEDALPGTDESSENRRRLRTVHRSQHGADTSVRDELAAAIISIEQRMREQSAAIQLINKRINTAIARNQAARARRRTS